MARRAAVENSFHDHYVTAREMYNPVRAAEAGWSGSVAEARDFLLTWEGREGVESPASPGTEGVVG